jgi:hypothetical protein
MMTRTHVLATLISLGLPTHIAAAAAADSRAVALVLDASGSMKEALPDGVTRMDAAKKAVAKLVGTLPADTRLAFRAYGHQSPPKAKNCKDTVLLAPFGAVGQNKQAVIAQANALAPQGYTPISYALQQAAGDLASEEATAHTVVLVSDGKETCPGDPCEVAKSLAEADAKLVIHTIGAGVDAATRQQLKCIADAARGMYQDAANTTELETVVAVAAETEAVEVAEPKQPASAEISSKKAGTAKEAPTSIGVGEIVRGRVTKDQVVNYWKLDAPAGQYRIILDAKRADDSGILLNIDVAAVGEGDSKKLLSIIDNQFKARVVNAFESQQSDLTLKVESGSDIVDYWLAVVRLDAKAPTPYFVKSPALVPLEVGKETTAGFDAQNREAWYSANLEGRDYKLTAEFTRTDNGWVDAAITMLGEFGQLGDPAGCRVIENASTASCSQKIVMGQDARVTFRLRSDKEAPTKVKFKLEPIE